MDEHDNTKRIYWVKNEDLDTEIASADDKIQEPSEKQVEGFEVDDDDDDDEDNIFDVTTPMKRSKTDDEEYVPFEEEKRPAKRSKTVSQNVKKKSLEQEGSVLKITNVSSVGPKLKGGKHFTDDRGYVYYQHSTTPFKRQLKCVFANVAKFKCQTTASMALDPPDSPISVSWKSTPHNHPPENEKTVASNFSKCLKKRVLEEPDVPLKKIYDDEKMKCPSGADVLPENIALQRMRRYRRVHIRSLQGHLYQNEPISDDEEPKPSKELEMLNEGKIIYVDAKGYQYRHQFASAHKRPTYQQITTLLEFIEENPVLMTGKLLNDEGGRVRFSYLWKDLKTRMNSIAGPSKSVKQWQKFWRTLQLKAKRKAAFFGKHAQADLDSRVASMVQIALDSMNDSERYETSQVLTGSTTNDHENPIVSTPESVVMPNISSEPTVESQEYGIISMVQKGILVVFMENNPSLRNVDIRIPKGTLDDLELGKWMKLVACLNSCGPEKSSDIWGKIWREMKISALAENNSSSAASKTVATSRGLDDIDSRVINCLVMSKCISSYIEQRPQQTKEPVEIPLEVCEITYETSARDSRNPKKIQKQQKAAMIEFLEKNRKMLRPKSFRGGPKSTTYKRMWADMAKLLNSLPGPKNTVGKWRRCLACYKTLARRKQDMADGNPYPTKHGYKYIKPITKFEKRLLALDKYVEEAGVTGWTDTSLLANDIYEGADTSDGFENSEIDDGACLIDDTGNSERREAPSIDTDHNTSNVEQQLHQPKETLEHSLNVSDLVSDSSTNQSWRGKRMRKEQKDALIDFLERNKEILKDSDGPKGPAYKKMWTNLANLLNSLPGPQNSVTKWRQGLSCLKSIARRKQNMADGKAFLTKNTHRFRYNTITTFEKRLLALEKYVNESSVNTGTDTSSLAKIIHKGPGSLMTHFDKSEVDDSDCTIYDTGDSIEEKGGQYVENEKPVGKDKGQTFSVADATNDQLKHLNESTEQLPNTSTQPDQFGFWRRIREEQKSALIDYLEKHRELCREVKTADCDTVARRNMWADLTNLLNSLPGPEYSINEWQQCLASYKSVAHRKRRMADGLMTSARSSLTDLLSNPLTCFEKRLLALSEPGGSDESSPAKVICDSSAEVGNSDVDVASSSHAWGQVGTRNPVEENYVKTTKTSDSRSEQKKSGTIENFSKKKHPVAINTSQLIMVGDSNEFLTQDQVDAMVEFMKANPSCDIYKWDEDKTNPKLAPFWVYLCNKLNKLGPHKDPDGWKKCWCLLKDSTNKKARLEKELSSLEVQILKFAKSKPVFMVQEDRKDVFMMKEIVRKTLPVDVEVSVVERELGFEDKEDISLEKQQESLQFKRGKYIRKRMTNMQKSTIVEFMLRNPLAQNYNGGSFPAKKRYRALWEELTEKLNSLGTQKSSLEWRRAWTDLKSNVMKKVEKGTEELTKLETEIRRMKYSEEDVSETIVSGRVPSLNPKDSSMITVNMEDLQNALNHSINEAGGSGIILAFDSSEQSEV